MAVVYTRENLNRFITKAKAENIHVLGKATGFTFQVPGSKGDALYTLIVGTETIMPNSAACNCPAGQNGICCKHGAAAIGAVRKHKLSEAAKVMRAAQVG